jgi:hypothetical protein
MVVQAVDKVLVGRVVGPERGDPGLIYVPNGGEGNVTVVHQDSADTYSVVATVQMFQGAKTIALDPVTHNAHQFQPERGPAAASTAKTATPVARPGGYGRGPQGANHRRVVHRHSGAVIRAALEVSEAGCVTA